MDINKKLAFYRSKEKPTVVNSTSNGDALPASLIALREHFDGEILHPQTPFLKIERKFPVEQGLGENRSLADVDLSFISKGILNESIDPEQCIFFDLETTGLAGGAGTFAFLLGFGHIVDHDFIITQYFLPDYGREYHLFKELQDYFNKFSTLISYNGKSYDAPLLKTRFILNQFEEPFANMKHIDLLHLSRRIWKGSFPSCDLGTIEQHILNLQRHNDIPGYLIPQAYFNHIRTGAIYDVIRMVEHNYIDVTSMLKLLLLFDKIDQTFEGIVTQKDAILRLGQVAFTMGMQELLSKLSNYFSNRYGTGEELQYYKSLLHKRKREWPEAIEIWQTLSSSSKYRFSAFEEMAKYYEHTKNDYKKATEITSKALNIFSTLEELNVYHPQLEIKQSFLHRMQRLNRKIS